MTIKHSNSPAGTQRSARLLAKKLTKKKLRQQGALILALTGDLGSGKTTFVQGFLRGLGVRGRITSPTFVLMKNYKLKTINYKLARHIDCYRVRKPSELIKLGIKEILSNPQNIVLIEWAEKIKKILPKNTIWLKFDHGEKENQRTIRIFV